MIVPPRQIDLLGHGGAGTQRVGAGRFARAPARGVVRRARFPGDRGHRCHVGAGPREGHSRGLSGHGAPDQGPRGRHPGAPGDRERPRAQSSAGPVLAAFDCEPGGDAVGPAPGGCSGSAPRLVLHPAQTGAFPDQPGVYQHGIAPGLLGLPHGARRAHGIAGLPESAGGTPASGRHLPEPGQPGRPRAAPLGQGAATSSSSGSTSPGTASRTSIEGDSPACPAGHEGLPNRAHARNLCGHRRVAPERAHGAGRPGGAGRRRG